MAEDHWVLVITVVHWKKERVLVCPNLIMVRYDANLVSAGKILAVKSGISATRATLEHANW